MCNNPLYRIIVNEWVAERLPAKFKARLRGGGVIINRIEYEYFRDIVCVPFELLQTIPCGQCLGCKVDYQNVWSTRAQLEATLHKNNYFVTLTYNEENINKNLFIDVVSGKTFEYGVLVKKDFIDFIKRLRRLLDYRDLNSCRFLCCGEYGDNGLRPHFHFIGFGLDIPDLVYYYSKSKKGALRADYHIGDDVFYRSALLEKAWGKGFVLVSNVSPFNCSYVASYVNKKVSPKTAEKNRTYSSFFELSRSFGKPIAVKYLIDMGLISSPFLHMSRRNGLAFSFFDSFQQEYYFENDRIRSIKNVKLFKIRLRYFDNLLEKADPIWYVLFKHKRKRKNFNPTIIKQWSREDLRLMWRREESLLENMKHKRSREL